MRLCRWLGVALVCCLFGACSPTPEQTDRAESVSPEQASEFFRQLETEVEEASTGSSTPVEPQMACEASTNAQDRALIARATEAALADARPFARGLGVGSHEAWVSAENPNVACGSLWFDAEGGNVSYVYVNGQVHGRWREISDEARGIPRSSARAHYSDYRARYCQFDWRTCDVAD